MGEFETFYAPALNSSVYQGMSERKTATIGLIDTRTETPGILGALIGSFGTMEAAFAANAAFQSQQSEHVRTKIVTLKESPPVGASVEPKHLPAEGEHLELSNSKPK